MPLNNSVYVFIWLNVGRLEALFIGEEAFYEMWKYGTIYIHLFACMNSFWITCLYEKYFLTNCL